MLQNTNAQQFDVFKHVFCFPLLSMLTNPITTNRFFQANLNHNDIFDIFFVQTKQKYKLLV